jgi:hypothetical protein
MIDVTEIKTASLTSEEAAASLAVAAQAAIQGDEGKKKANAKSAAAEAVMIAGFSDDSIASMVWSFDVTAGNGDVHQHVETIGYTEHGTETAAWVLNGQGQVSRVAQGAYKRGFHRAIFALPEAVPAVWTMTGRAIALANAIRGEGMTARIEAGALKLEGGNSDKAKAMREASSLSALRTAAKGAAGSNREAPQNDKSKGGGAADAALNAVTREQILRAAFGELSAVDAGDGAALNGAEVALLKGLAKVAASIAKAEAEAEKAEKAEAARKAARNA